MFGYITCGFLRIFGYVLQVIKYSISVPLDRGGFGGYNLMLTFTAKLGLSPLHPISFAFLFILPFVSFILSMPQFLDGSAPAQMFVHFLDKSIEYSQLFLKKGFSQLS